MSKLITERHHQLQADGSDSSNCAQVHPSTSSREASRRAWQQERTAARTARERSDFAGEWHHLERAHVLSQPMAGPHVRTHMAMLSFGIRAHDRREILGQIFRVVVAGPGSWSGHYPEGNTGGAAISAFSALPIPADLLVYRQAQS